MAADRSRAGYIAVAGLLGLLAGLWLVRPWLHGLVITLYANPSIVEALALGALGSYAYVRLTPGLSVRRVLAGLTQLDRAGDRPPTIEIGRLDRQAATSGLVVAVTVFLVIAPLALGGPYAQEHIANTLSVESIDELPEIDADRPRVLPKSVARQYAENSLQLPRYQLTESDIAFRDGRPTWAFGLAPDGTINNLLLVGKGAAFVDMTTVQKRVEVVEADLQVGFGFGLASGEGVVSKFRWRLLKEEFLVNYADPVMVDAGDELYIAVPYVSYAHHVRFTPFPVVYTTPHWGGVALIAPDGDIEHLSPGEARAHPVLEGQRLFPFDLARYYVESMRYKHGIVNKWFVHEDELEVAPLPGEDNEQPFLAVTETAGIQYFVAAEPYGNAQGIYQVWMFDGRTGQAQRFQLPVDSALMGPARAADFVRKANDRTDWDRFSPSEPVPAVIDGTLFWQVKVVPSDSSGIAYTAFVDAESGDVFTFSTDDRIRAFLAGALDGGQTDREPTEGAAIVITIRDANGTVVNTVTLTEGQSLEIQYRNTTTAGG